MFTLTFDISTLIGWMYTMYKKQKKTTLPDESLLVQLKKVGVALSTRMREHSSDLRLGFGSFVDKNVSPYINVHPSKINNPCR